MKNLINGLSITSIYLIFAIIFSVLILLMLIKIISRREKNSDNIHGSARWAYYSEIKKIGLLSRISGIYLGGFLNKSNNMIEYLRSQDNKHVIAFAPTRSGKGVGLVIPTLLSWPESSIILDVKGENWGLTSGYRKFHLNNHVIRFDPTSSINETAKFNPLNEIRIGESEVRDIQNIVNILIDPQGKGEIDHWRRSASSLLTGAILHVLYSSTEKNLNSVKKLLSNPNLEFKQTLNYMLTAEHDQDYRFDWRCIFGNKTKTHPVVASVAREMLDKAEEERASILSTALSFLSIFQDPIISKNTSKSDFTIDSLVNADKPVSLYLTIPPSDISRIRPILRMIFDMISTRLVEKFSNKHKHRLLLMLDEFPILGKIESFQDSLAYMAGYGIQSYIICQDLAQLYNAYGKSESITSNCDIRIAYTPNKYDTADYISKMLGITTVDKKVSSLSGKRLGVYMENQSFGEQQTQRMLMTSDEVMRLDKDQMIIFHSNNFPILGYKIKYYDDPVLNGKTTVKAPDMSDVISGKQNTNKFPIIKEKIESLNIEKVDEDILL